MGVTPRVTLPILVRRLVQAFLVALWVGTLCFVMLRMLPGDMAYRIAGSRYGYDIMSSAGAERVRAELGLDRPASQAWLEWMGSLARLDLGVSFITGRTVSYEISQGLGHTLQLSGLAFLLSLCIGPPLGMIAGLRPGGVADRITLVISVLLRTLPPFLIGLVLILVFAVHRGVLPAGGNADAGAIVLPALTLALGLAAVSMRITRQAMAAVASSDYFEFARTKGLPLRSVLLRHGLRNVGVPVVAYLGYQMVYLIEGVVVVETIFAWPGIGHGLVHAILGSDVPMLQGTALTMGLLFTLLNTAVDFACVAIDPRLRRA